MLVALGVTGGIAAYKACEIVRGLDQAGVEVQVILTRNGAEFITPLTLQTLSRRKVIVGQYDLDTDAPVQHIELTRNIDALLVAPATANVLAKFARGVADDFLSTFFVAVTAPVVVAPAMNTRMWMNPVTRENLAALRARGVRVIDPESGWLAEQEEGPGRLADPETIVTETLAVLRRSSQLRGRKIVVSAGPTREAIDPVRYISNRSSGKMGYALADAAARRGADVVLVSGPVSRPVPFGVRMVGVRSAREMRDAILREREGAHAIFMAAAVSDYLPEVSTSKLKKTGSALTLTLNEGSDILAEIGRSRGDEILVGFAAETEDLLANARGKMERKNVDFIVANDVATPGVGLDADDNAVTILDRNGGILEVDRAPKRQVAETILDHVFGGQDS
jgi:phosphopantothenoylcysteine decarboxylase/phosphopantothenate--cysteine ligase